jgi:asparagine synthase (glutamine-hydrolysing)
MFAPIAAEVADVWTRDIFRDVLLTHDNALDRPEDYINQSLYLEAKTFLHGLFVVEDKLSMAHSLENRVPFMDNELVDFAMRCPVGLKLNNLAAVLRINENEPGRKKDIHFQKTNDGKQILREVMERYILKDVAEARKQGFSSPDASWFKGESIEYVKCRLFNEKSAIYEFLNPSAVKRLVTQHLNGEQNRRLLIWSLLSVDEFIANQCF